MKILISSHAFAPSVGGIETVSALLAEEFSKLGHVVMIVTQTAAESEEQLAVVRQPSLRTLFGLVSWCDVFWQNNLSLRSVWPALLARRPVVITHQGSYCRQPQGLDLPLRLQRAFSNSQTSVAISRFVASCFKPAPPVIPNPYDARVFTQAAAAERSDDLIFVGRLVSEKGLDLLFQSLAALRARELRPHLTVVGSGPEENSMRQLAARLDLVDQVTWSGMKRGPELAEILNRHKILVVPSRYQEPFGVVALEGIACGCVVVGSNGGGLPEAIGPCGTTFPNGDAAALADALERLLARPEERRQFSAAASEHLSRFHPATIANSYLNLFQSKLP